MNAAKMTLASTVLAAALGLALGLMSAPAAADHKAGHTKGGGGDGSGDTPTIVETTAQWSGGINGGATEPRACVAAQVKTNGDWGSYTCRLDPPDTGNEVQHALGVGIQTARNGDAFLCNVFDGVDLTPNRNYGYAWTDNCGDGACSIRIMNWFKGAEVIAATSEKADRITLVAWAEAMNGATGVIDDPNPFTNSHTLEVDEITISFFANGSNKKIAVCEYSPDPGDVTFQSDPTP